MFLYPALTLGFLFVGVPLLVHLINVLRHRRQRWAAMDFLLASYRKQKKWIRLRQLLLLLSRLAVAALLAAVLSGWTGAKRMLGILGGEMTHHVVILDDSYSMGDQSVDSSFSLLTDEPVAGNANASTVASAYQRGLQSLQDLTRRLAADDGNHQLTVMRASRAAIATRGGGKSGDVAADLSAQTVTADARLISRVMSTTASPLRTDIVAAVDLATELVDSTPADSKYLYIVSDFRQRDWGSIERIAAPLKNLSPDVTVRMIDCAANPSANLGITEVSPVQDVWVAGVPVVVQVKVRNYGSTAARNVALTSRVIKYDSDLQSPDPGVRVSGEIETLPNVVIESLAAGEEVTKTFQVFITEQGTHAIEITLPDDALAIDNVRSCTIPLSDVERVLIIDGDNDQRGAYHVASVLDPGSQVRIGALPDIQPTSFLRSATAELLSRYRAIYLIDVPEVGENAAEALSEYVRRGGGIAWFLGERVNRQSYNQSLLTDQRRLLPGVLESIETLKPPEDSAAPDVLFGDPSELLAPLRRGGDAAFALVRISKGWDLDEELKTGAADTDEAPVRNLLLRRDGKPWVTMQDQGNGRVLTVLSGLEGDWTNWPGDPSFVVFLLRANAMLWSAAAPTTSRLVSDSLEFQLPADEYVSAATYLPASREPPRVPIEVQVDRVEPASAADQPLLRMELDPGEMIIDDDSSLDEVLTPGVSEWALTRNDGRGEVVPVASVIEVGEGDLARADQATIAQQLQPLQVQFISSRDWSAENRTAGSPTLMLVLLALLGTMLAAEQGLAYWASYHSNPTASMSTRSVVGGVSPNRAGGHR